MQAPRELLARKVRQRAHERFLVTADHLGVLRGEEVADERCRIGVCAPQEPEEVLAAALLVARELERGNQHREEDLLAREWAAERLALDSLEQDDALLVHRVEAAREDRLEELFLGPEGIVDRREVDACRGGAPPQAARPHPAPPHKIPAGTQEPRL